MTAVRFAPGRGVAYATSATLVLADHAEVDRTLAGLVLRDAPVPDLLEALGDADAALARFDGDVVELAVRGAVAVDVERDEDRSPPAAPDVDGPATSRRLVTGVTGVTAVRFALDDAAAATASFVIAEGAVPAAVLDWQSGSSPAHDVPDPFDAMFGHTISRSVEDAAVRPGGPPSERPPLGVLVFSTGERVLVDRPLLLGRNPRAEADGELAREVRLVGAGVSRRHARIHVDHWHAAIDDLGSVNGTDVTLPGHPRRRVTPGQPVALVPGAHVDLGGEVSFVVEEVA